MNEQVEGQLTLFPVDSPASRFLVLESDEVRKMTAISGRKCYASLKKSGPNGWSEKTYLDLFEERLRIFFPTLREQVTKQGLTVVKLGMSEDCFEEKELLLWPRPTTGSPLCGGTGNFRQMKKMKEAGIITEQERKNLTCGSGGKSNPALMEWLMGFPIGWTDLNA